MVLIMVSQIGIHFWIPGRPRGPDLDMVVHLLSSISSSLILFLFLYTYVVIPPVRNCYTAGLVTNSPVLDR